MYCCEFEGTYIYICVRGQFKFGVYIYTHCKRHLQHYNEKYVHAHSQGYYKLIYRLHYIFLYLHIDRYNDIGKNGRIQK
jgi:hypothetical protein